MSLLLTGLLVSIATVAAIIYFYIKNAYSYWQKRGVATLPTTFPFGNFKKSFRMALSPAEMMQEFYLSTSEPYLGLYGALRPILLLRDPEVIRNVLVRDFQHFQDHGLYNEEKNDPLLGNLFHSSGSKWRNLRVKLSPTFTSGKIKAMFSTLVDSSVPLQQHISKSIDKQEPIEVRELSARYATNVIASVAFGIDINCIEDPDTEFRKYGRKVFAPTLKNGMRGLFGFLSPAFMNFFKARAFDRDVYDFMTSVVRQNLEYREQQNVIRKDFFQLLVQLRNTGTVLLDDQWETEITNDENRKALSLDEVTAQAFVFYLAGFETSSTTMSFCLYEIARNPEIQQKLQREIDDVLANHNGQLTYNSINEMKFLEACIDETLRKYPPVPMLNRICTKEYTIPNTDIVITEGTSIVIPNYAIHYDKTYYENPHEFQPERFYEENRKTFNERPYMPFGEGPRVCIGMRMGKMQTKAGLVAMLRKFDFDLSNEKLRDGLKFNPKSFIMMPLDRLDLKVSYR